MIRLSILALCTIFVMTAQALNTVPVFILDEGRLNGIIQSELDPFVEITKEMFEKLMLKIEEMSETIIFFIEEDLALQDITAKDHKGTTFPQSRREFFNKNLKMFLQVENPYSYIKKQYPSYGMNEFHLRSTMSKLRLKETYKHMFIFFEDNMNETRTGRLRRHDSIIQQVYFGVKQISKGPVIAIYTGKHGPEKWKEQGRSEVSNDNASKMLQTHIYRITFDCDNATFELYDAQLFMSDPMPPLEPDICTFHVLKQSQWAYDLLFKSGEAFISRIQFVFTYLDSNNREKGWKLIEVSYATEEDKVLQSQPLDIVGNWTNWYTSKAPLVIHSSPGNVQSKLSIGKYVILLNKNKPLTTTTIGTEPSLTAKSTITGHGSYESPWKWGQEGQSHPLAWSIPGNTGSPGREGGYKPKSIIDHSSHSPEDQGGARYGYRDQSHRSEASGARSNRIHLGPGYLNPDNEDNFIRTDNNTNNNPSTPVTEGPDVMVTPAILMGLIVVFVMVYVLIFGVGMMMAINTNSRYDSPDSKPLFDPETIKD